jgi:hypothetical protein
MELHKLFLFGLPESGLGASPVVSRTTVLATWAGRVTVHGDVQGARKTSRKCWTKGGAAKTTVTTSKRTRSQDTSACRANSRAARMSAIFFSWPMARSGVPVFVRPARFHFHNHECLALPADQIDLAIAGCRPVVAPDDCETGSLEESMRQVFAAAPHRNCRIQFPGVGMVPENIRDFVQPPQHSRLLDGLELELHHFASNDIAKIVFPEPPKARKSIHQEFESEIAPERK